MERESISYGPGMRYPLSVALLTSVLVLGLFVVLFLYGAPCPGIFPFARRPFFQFMPFRRAWRRGREAPDRVRMYVGSAIHPSPAPRPVVNYHDVVAPVEVGKAQAPSPRTKRKSNSDPKTEADGG